MNNKKPILNDAVKMFTDEEILGQLFKFYPDEVESRKGYQKVLNELRAMKHKRNKMQIVVELVEDTLSDEHEKYTNVSGFMEGKDMTYAIEFVPWDKWLGMKVHESSFVNYGYLDIIAYCLWEMTWMGFKQEKIQSQYKEMVDVAKKAKADFKKEKKCAK